MRLKLTLLIFLTVYCIGSPALENSAQNNSGVDQIRATQKEIGVLKGLIKKGFSTQAQALQNGNAALVQLQAQLNAIDAALDAINLQQSNELSYLHFINSLLGALFILQFFNSWLLRCHFKALTPIKIGLPKKTSSAPLDKNLGSSEAILTPQNKASENKNNVDAPTTGGQVSITKIEVSAVKAKGFYSIKLEPPNLTEDISGLLSSAEKIKSQELARVHSRLLLAQN